MKKSKIVGITLLALSIAGCHKKSQRPPANGWDEPNSYVSTDGGYNYQQGGSGFPFWFYMYMMQSHNGGYVYGTGATYHSYYRSTHGFGHSGYNESYAGHSTSRGGFGSSGRSGG